MEGAFTLAAALDRVAELHAEGNLLALKDVPPASPDSAAEEIRFILLDRQIRREHRDRIYQDLVANREFLLREQNPRLVHLIFWSEHVERLYASLRKGRLGTFHFTRALEATCRRCGYDLLPAMGRLDELGKAWSQRDYAAAHAFLSAHFVEVEPPREAPEQLGPHA
jgi:hypothetical protein